MTFRITGMEDLEKALSEVAKQSTRTAIARRSLAKAAQPMLDLAKNYAAIRSGKLEASLRISSRIQGEVGNAAYHKWMKHSAEAAKALGVSFDRQANMALAVKEMRTARRSFKAVNPSVLLYLGPTQDVWYAHFVEFGTKPHITGGRFKGAQHSGSAPDPFLRPAFDAEVRATIDRLAPMVWNEIQRNAARVAKRAAKAG